jgi:hypothetical protein
VTEPKQARPTPFRLRKASPGARDRPVTAYEGRGGERPHRTRSSDPGGAGGSRIGPAVGGGRAHINNIEFAEVGQEFIVNSSLCINVAPLANLKGSTT